MMKFANSIQVLPKKKNCVRIFTDGSCHPNDGTGPGGWSFIINYQDGRATLKSKGGESPTTNNRMELTAAIKAIQIINENGDGERQTIELVTDSEYVGKGIVYWMSAWARTNWKNKNSDLWKELYKLVQANDVYVTCIRGHRGQLENEECDKMAVAARLSIGGTNAK